YNTAALEHIAQSLVEVATIPHCERYESLSAADLAKYGLDKPYLKLKLTPTKEGGLARELLIGKTISKDSSDRFARASEGGAVCVLRGDVVKVLDVGPLELVDTLLLNVNLDSVARIAVQSGDEVFALTPHPSLP